MSLGAPSPLRTSELPRQQHSRLRRRMLYGEWLEDLRSRIRARVGRGRARAWGAPDLSANPFRSICQQVAVLYDSDPVLSHPDDPDGRAAAVLSAALTAAGAWQIMARVQRDTVGIREQLVRVDVDDPTGRLIVRQVYSDLVEPGPSSSPFPDRLGSIREYRERETGSDCIWTIETVDPTTQRHTIEDTTGTDVTDKFMGMSGSGERYLYRDRQGRPVLPYVLYHAARTPSLWDPYGAREAVEGTLDVGVLWTFWHHTVRDASWPQRYAAGYTPAGGRAGSGVREVETDPTVLLILQALGEAGQGIIGQWNAGVDVQVLADAILTYERRLAGYLGISPSDFARISGDPRSAYALMISRDGQREAARRMQPQFSAGDAELVALCAMALNRWSELEGNGPPLRLPERGWRLRYPAIPRSAEELAAIRADVLDRLDRGLITRLDAFMALNEDLTRTEAQAALATIERERRPLAA